MVKYWAPRSKRRRKLGELMAACDNLYGNFDEWNELFIFLYENKREYLMWMKPPPIPDGIDITRICYIAEIQDWLIENCPLQWVIEKLNQNFTIQRIICGKAHHEK